MIEKKLVRRYAYQFKCLTCGLTSIKFLDEELATRVESIHYQLNKECRNESQSYL